MSNVNELIDCCIGSRGSHYDIAKIAYLILRNDFTYHGNNTWYYRTSDMQWIIDEGRKELEMRIRLDICRAITERAIYWQNMAIISPANDISLRIDSQIRSVKLLNICMKLGKPRFLRELIKECRSFFVTED